jgi:hypothetical protein
MRAIKIEIAADEAGGLHMALQGNLSAQEILLGLEMIKADILKKVTATSGFDMSKALNLNPRRLP